MARKPSAVLTAAEKKDLLRAAKVELREAKAAAGEVAKRVKEVAKARKEVVKQWAAEDKAFDKEAVVAAKNVAALEEKVAGLTA